MHLSDVVHCFHGRNGEQFFGSRSIHGHEVIRMGQAKTHKRWRHAALGCLWVLTMQCLVSCSWNRAFLQPEKIPGGDRMAMGIDAHTGDTTYLSITGPNAQPAFLNSARRPISLPYTVESYFIGQPGASCNAWYIRSAMIDPHFVVIFLHGNGGNIYSEYPVILPLIERGACVYMIDYRGYGRSEGKATRDHVIEDAEQLLHDVIKRTEGSGMPIILYGQSLGGHTAAVISGALPSAVNGVVVESGFLSFKAMARHAGGLGAIGAWFTKEGPKAAHALARYNGPFLLIHSEEDQVVPIEQANAMFEIPQGEKVFLKVSGLHATAPSLYPDSVVAGIHRVMGW